jgi:hypothetical protein
MRRLVFAALFVASSFGIYLVPAGADPSVASKVTLSFDYSDNTAPASASNGTFNIIVDVLPEQTPGVVRISAVSPDGLISDNLACGYQNVTFSQVECAFNFSSSGVWAIRAQYATSKQDDVSTIAKTNLRVSN